MRSRIAGFSLVELMVAVGIVGILAVIAVPRYKSFLVQARRGEAKANLSHLASLQEVYKVEHYTYYQGSAMKGTEGIGYKDGDGNMGLCNDPSIDIDQGLGNELGFRPGGTTAGCRQLRYFYQFNAAGDVAVASAASDGNKHIYPDCNGYSQGCEECGYKYGDALTMALGGGKPEVCRNITKYCPDGASCPTTPCPASCPTGQVMHPAPACCQPITCPATTTCLATETLHTSPPCCRPTPCPATCPAGQTLYPAPKCCATCGCAYDGETQTGTWTTTNSTPSGAVTQANAYTCESLNQEAKFTETWSETPVGCAISDPCSNKTYFKHQGIQGDKPPDCSNDADKGLSACPCEGSDTRTTAPNDCCLNCVSDTVTTRSGYSWGIANISLDLDNEWDCQVKVERLIDTTTHYPSPPCPTPTEKRRADFVCGQKVVDCFNSCNDVAGMEVWGNCEKHPTESDPDRYLRLKTIPRVCTSPCAGSSTRCPSLDPTTCPQERRKYHPCECADSGHYNTMTESVARTYCESNGTDWKFTATPNGATIKCKCVEDDPPSPCFDHNNVAIPDDVIEACNKATGTYWDAENCVCMGSSGGMYSITLCISPATWDYSGLLGTIDGIGGSVPAAFTNLKHNNGGIDQVYFTNANNWSDILAKIRCGSPGASAFASDASVQTLNHLIRNHTEKIDNVANTAYGYGDTNVFGQADCSITPMTVEWTCN